MNYHRKHPTWAACKVSALQTIAFVLKLIFYNKIMAKLLVEFY